MTKLDIISNHNQTVAKSELISKTTINLNKSDKKLTKPLTKAEIYEKYNDEYSKKLVKDVDDMYKEMYNHNPYFRYDW